MHVPEDAAPQHLKQPESDSPLEWALYYAAHGHPILPLFEVARSSDSSFRCTCDRGARCTNAGKHPRTEHGLHDATTAEDQIRHWWTRWPNANVGLRTGDAYLVLDVDVDKGGDDSLGALEAKYAKLPETRQALTGSLGQHRWFRLPGGIRIGCFNGFEDGLDVRGDGGYVVVEPSNHRSGNIYRWDGMAGFEEQVADVPKWLLNILIARKDKNGGGEPWRQVEITINRHPELPPELVDFIQKDPDLSSLWNLQRDDFADAGTGKPNLSRYDLALASHFVSAGVAPQQVADVLTAFRLKHGNPKGKAYRRDYLRRTIHRATQGNSGSTSSSGHSNAAQDGGDPVEARRPNEESTEGQRSPHQQDNTFPDSEPTSNRAPEQSSTPPSGGESISGEANDYFKAKVPGSVEFLVAQVEAAKDPAVVYEHIESFAALSEAELAVVYQRLKAALGSKLNRIHFDKAIAETRARLKADQSKTGEPKSPSGPSHPYREISGSIFRIKTGKAGVEEYVPLTNFTAQIVSDITEDDGLETIRFFGISATAGRQAQSFIVPASEFTRMDWVLESIGPHGIVNPNQKDWARAGIQSLSKDIKTSKIYIHTGWRRVGGSMLYLHGGGAIGPGGADQNIDVRLSGAMAHYELLLPENHDQLVLSVRASLRMLEVAPDHVAFPVHAAPYRAAIRSCDFGMWLSGPTGVFKSEEAALAQQHFGAAMNARRLPANFASTGNSLEVLAFTAKDALLVIDDFAPSGSSHDVARYHSSADRILRAAGNNQGRGRLSADARLKDAKPPRGLILATGEDLPRGQSIRGRTLIVEVAPGDVNTAVLTECQMAAASGAYARAMGGFIQWIAGQYENVQTEFQARLLELRSRVTKIHSRTPGIVADLCAGFELFLRFAASTGAISASERQKLGERCWEALNRVAKAQLVQHEAAEPTHRFLELLRAAILSGQAYVAGLDGGAPAGDGQWGWQLIGSGDHERLVSKGKCIGWLDGASLYLEPTASYSTAQDVGRSTGEPLAVSEITIRKRLNEKGLLASTELSRGTLTVRRTICGELIPVIHLRGDVLSVSRVSSDNSNTEAESAQKEVFSC
jgi:hypothetical protein